MEEDYATVHLGLFSRRGSHGKRECFSGEGQLRPLTATAAIRLLPAAPNVARHWAHAAANGPSGVRQEAW
jgi:hypothetical protein